MRNRITLNPLGSLGIIKLEWLAIELTCDRLRQAETGYDRRREAHARAFFLSNQLRWFIEPAVRLYPSRNSENKQNKSNWCASLWSYKSKWVQWCLIHVCVYVYVQVCVCLCICICINIYTHVYENENEHVYVSVYTIYCIYCIYCIYIYICTWMCMYMYMCMCMCLSMYDYACLYVCMCVRPHVGTCTLLYTCYHFIFIHLFHFISFRFVSFHIIHSFSPICIYYQIHI